MTEKEKPMCGDCGEEIEEGQSCYAIQSGRIVDGKFIGHDCQRQLFHIRCLNSED